MVLLCSDSETGGVSTIVIRGATDNILDDIERGLNDGINTFKALTKVHYFNYKIQLHGVVPLTKLSLLGQSVVGWRRSLRD